MLRGISVAAQGSAVAGCHQRGCLDMLRQVTIGRRFEFWGYPKFSQIAVGIDTEVTYRVILGL